MNEQVETKKQNRSRNTSLKQKVDELLPACVTFEDLISALKLAGCSVSEKRKLISVQLPGQGRPIRLTAKSLGEDYTEAAIRERIAQYAADKSRGVRSAGTGGSSDSGTHTRVNLLIDIQAKIREGKGAGYERWAKAHVNYTNTLGAGQH